MRNKRVLFINPYLPTLGGGEKHMSYMAQFIENYYQDCVDIDILVFNYNDIDVRSSKYVTIEKLNQQFGLDLTHTKLLKLDNPVTKNSKKLRKFTFEIEKLTKEYDIMINFMFESKYAGKAKKNFYGCMFPPVPYSNEGRKGIKRWIGKILDFRFYFSYQAFLANSEFTLSWLNKWWFHSKRNRVIYPPVFQNSDKVNRYDVSKKENIILSVGRFFTGNHSKKQLELVKFFVNSKEKFLNYQFHLVGAVFDSEEDKKYLNEIKSLATTVDNIIIHENYPFSKLIDLYKKAKIFWHATGFQEDENQNPRRMEHFGITTVEAMSYGVVPIVINKGGQVEIVDNGVNGYLWDSEQECIEKTCFLIKHPEILQKLANKAFEKADCYSVESFYENNSKLFKENQL